MAKSKIGLNLQMPSDVYENFKMLCGFKNTSMTAATIDLIRAYLEENSKLIDFLNAQQKLFNDAIKNFDGDSDSVNKPASVVKDVSTLDAKGAGK